MYLCINPKKTIMQYVKVIVPCRNNTIVYFWYNMSKFPAVNATFPRKYTNMKQFNKNCCKEKNSKSYINIISSTINIYPHYHNITLLVFVACTDTRVACCQNLYWVYALISTVPTILALHRKHLRILLLNNAMTFTLPSSRKLCTVQNNA
jgi:hypothetical protein